MKCPICKKSDEVVTRPDGPYCLDCGRAVLGPSDATACSPSSAQDYAYMADLINTLRGELEDARDEAQKARAYKRVLKTENARLRRMLNIPENSKLSQPNRE